MGILRRFGAAALTAVVCACTSGSQEFDDVLESPNGGSGTASIAIKSFTPGSASLVVKETENKQFLVSAVGEGTLLYKWTLNGVAVGSDSPTYDLDASLQTVGDYVLKLTINDDVGTVSQEWKVKINGPPVISASLPVDIVAQLRRNSTLNYAVTVSDPNADTLTYVWKLDGREDLLTSTLNNTDWTPASVDVGLHQISVDIYDGPASDTGTYKVTRSWTTYVNNFSSACNVMENSNLTNASCIFTGIPGIGDGRNPATASSNFYMRPASLAATPENNIFIGDDANHVVWFYNKYSAPSVDVLGVTVPVNTAKVVAGIGMASNGNSSSPKALRNFLNSPHGLFWDGTSLYISDTSNNKVLRVDSAGDLTVISSAGCNSPRGLAVSGGFLFVACYGSNIVVQIDVSNLVKTTFAGTGAAGNPANLNESTPTDATNGRLNGPYALTADSSGNIYVGEYTGCRVRFYNRSGGDVTLYGSYLIHDGFQRVLAGVVNAATCGLIDGEPVAISGATDGRVGNVRGLLLNSAGHLLISSDQDRIAAINFSPAPSSIFGVPIGAYQLKSVIGSGTAGYLGEGQLPLATRLNNPFNLAEDLLTNDLYIADNGNLRLRRIKASDSKTELVAGNGSTRSQANSGQGQLEAGQEKMNSIRGLAIDGITNEVFVADSGNHRIRVINRYGVVSQAVGTGGAGSGAEENEFPSNVTMNQPRGLVLTHRTPTFGGHLVWADSQNHRIRIWNRSTADKTLFGVAVGAGLIVTIGGDGLPGNATSGTALQSAFNQPGGVAWDGTDLYVSDTNNHCIKKIDASGNLEAVAGTCGVAGNVNGPAGVGRMNGPEGIDYYENGVHRGLLIAARGNGRIKFHRFAGTSLLFGGSTSIGDTNSIACGGTFHTENINANLAPCSGTYDVATVGTKVCFTNFSYHNARCILPSGEISTVMGSIEGIDDSVALFSPGGAFAHEDYDSSTPNYGAQNGVEAFYMPSVLTGEASLNTSYGKLAYPMPIRPLDDRTVIVGEYYLGILRKVKLP